MGRCSPVLPETRRESAEHRQPWGGAVCPWGPSKDLWVRIDCEFIKNTKYSVRIRKFTRYLLRRCTLPVYNMVIAAFIKTNQAPNDGGRVLVVMLCSHLFWTWTLQTVKTWRLLPIITNLNQVFQHILIQNTWPNQHKDVPHINSTFFHKHFSPQS